jgi:hypothetical protein
MTFKNRRFMINYMKDIECISRIPHGFARKVCKSQSVWTIQKHAIKALNLAHHGNFGMYKEATDILKTLAICPQS